VVGYSASSSVDLCARGSVAKLLGQPRRHLESDVVPRSFVFSAGVSQADDQLHIRRPDFARRQITPDKPGTDAVENGCSSFRNPSHDRGLPATPPPAVAKLLFL